MQYFHGLIKKVIIGILRQIDLEKLYSFISLTIADFSLP